MGIKEGPRKRAVEINGSFEDRYGRGERHALPARGGCFFCRDCIFENLLQILPFAVKCIVFLLFRPFTPREAHRNTHTHRAHFGRDFEATRFGGAMIENESSIGGRYSSTVVVESPNCELQQLHTAAVRPGSSDPKSCNNR